MSIHQIIYTSCKRGIRGVNDGQQIFSYDRAFPEGSIDEVKGMFTYIMPALEPGVIMTEELATTMPQAFLYRRLPSGKGAMALNTYLGRDYMGSAGRFGNQLSHVILCDPEDLEDYPCRFFGSDAFRSRMEFEEVNNPGQPDYLPQPQLTTGPLDVERVTDFLSQEDRMPVYLNMLWAMLAFRSQRKRLVICDRQEHIPCWIAALEFALPLSMALDINFTTYEYDPSLSEAQICGVVPRGTRFDPMNAPQHFTFDLLGRNCPEFPEKDPEFFDFVDTALSFSYDSMEDFHGFLTRTGYDKADEGIYDAYALYTLLSDGPGDFDRERLQRAVDFAERSGKETLCDRLTAMLLDTSVIPVFYHGAFTVPVTFPVVMCIALCRGNLMGLLYGMIGGLLIDITTGTLGMEMAFYMAAGFLIGLIVAVYLLAIRKRLARQGVLLVRGALKPKWADLVLEEIAFVDKMFGGFIDGKIVDSAIIGVLCYIGCVIFRFPNALLISVFVGITNVIPFFGPFIGAIPSIFLILIVDPLKALWFALFILALQQLDGNVIGPKILGDRTGLSSFWVLFSIVLFGGLWGLPGMVICVPLFAVIYDTIKKLVYRGLKKNGQLPIWEAYKQDFGEEAPKPRSAEPEKPKFSETEAETAETETDA